MARMKRLSFFRAPLNAVDREKQLAAAAQAIAEAPTLEAAAEVVERVKQLGLDVPESWESESWESTVSATNEPGPAQAARTAEPAAPEPVEGEAGQDGEGVDSADERMEVETDAAERREQQQREHEQAEAAEAAALDEEAAEEPMDDFMFDESGARVGAAWHAETEVNEGALPGDEAGAGGDEEAAEALEDADEAAAAQTGSRKRRRKARTRKVLSQAPGTEAGAAGIIRVETEQLREAKMFSASNYMWLFYAVAPGTGLLRVPVGQRAEAGQCHAILDDAANADADQIAGSNSTYCFAGISAEHPEMLYTRTYACSCVHCRDPNSIHFEFASCPNMSTVGKWRQDTIQEAGGITKQKATKKIATEAFAKEIKAEQVYAVYASYNELGGRAYWLLLTKSAAKKAAKAIRVKDAATIRKGQCYVDAQWYLSTSESQENKSYKLLDSGGENGDGVVQVPVASIVQEHGLEWERTFRNGEHLLSNESHVAIARHNFSNVSVSAWVPSS